MGVRGPTDIDDMRMRRGFVLIKPGAEVNESQGGILFSAWHETRQRYGIVVACGSDVDVNLVGRWVLFQRWAGEHLGTYESDTYVIARVETVQAVLESDTLKPIGRWVAVEPVDDRPKETSGGLALAGFGYLHAFDGEGKEVSVETDEYLPNKGTVAAVGPDCVEQIRVGESVVVEPDTGTELTLGARDYLLVPETQILARIT